MPNNRIVMECKSQTVLDVLNKIIARVAPEGMRPVMMQIGENLMERTKQRFDSSTSPEGYLWKPLAEGTVLARLQKITGAYQKSGKRSAKGNRSVMRMKPLIETGGLKRDIHYQIIDGGAGVEIGTNRFAEEWEGGAAVHQFGSKDGKIPARPFLGLSNGDKTMVLDILNKFIEEAAQLQK